MSSMSDTFLVVFSDKTYPNDTPPCMLPDSSDRQHSNDMCKGARSAVIYPLQEAGFSCQTFCLQPPGWAMDSFGRQECIVPR